jgi:hypothetical protein
MITGGWSPRGTAFGGVRSAWISASGRPVPSSASARVSTSSPTGGPIWPPRRSASAISCDGGGAEPVPAAAGWQVSCGSGRQPSEQPGAPGQDEAWTGCRCRLDVLGDEQVPAAPERQHRRVARAALGRERRARQTGQNASGSIHRRGSTRAPKARATRSEPPLFGRSRYTSTSSTLSKDSGWPSDSATA